MKSLQKEKLIQEEITYTKKNILCRKFRLTASGKVSADKAKKRLKPQIISTINSYSKKFEGKTPSQILRYVYEKYPAMTVNSKLLD